MCSRTELEKETFLWYLNVGTFLHYCIIQKFAKDENYQSSDALSLGNNNFAFDSTEDTDFKSRGSSVDYYNGQYRWFIDLARRVQGKYSDVDFHKKASFMHCIDLNC